MPRAGDELHAHPLDVVVGAVDSVDFQLAAVAGTGVDMADGDRLAEHFEDFRVQVLLADAQGEVGLRRRLGDPARLEGFLPDDTRSHFSVKGYTLPPSPFSLHRSHKSCPL